MKKPKGPGKGVRVTNPLVPAPAKHHHRHRHQKPGKPHHQHHPGHRMSNPLVPGPKLHKAPHHHRHKKPKQPVKRKLSVGDVACCSAEALAASLRLLGVPVGDEDVLALYWRTAADADAGASISATLEAAQRFGLAGVRPRFDLIGDLDEGRCDVTCLGRREVVGALLDAEQLDDGTVDAAPAPQFSDGGRVDRRLVAAQQFRDLLLDHPASVVLGVALPGGPHALTLDPSGAVWSWGELYDLSPDVAIEEAWTVDWSI